MGFIKLNVVNSESCVCVICSRFRRGDKLFLGLYKRKHLQYFFSRYERNPVECVKINSTLFNLFSYLKSYLISKEKKCMCSTIVIGIFSLKIMRNIKNDLIFRKKKVESTSLKLETAS